MDPVTKDEVSNGPYVFIANFAGHDYTSVEQWGKSKFLTRGFISYQGLDRLKFQIAEGVMETAPDDWLAISGASIINVIAAVLWYQKHGKIKLLNFDKTTQKYRELILSSESNAKLLEVLSESRTET